MKEIQQRKTGETKKVKKKRGGIKENSE